MLLYLSMWWFMKDYKEITLIQLKAQREYIKRYGSGDSTKDLNLIFKMEELVKRYTIITEEQFEIFDQILIAIDNRVSSKSITIKR